MGMREDSSSALLNGCDFTGIGSVTTYRSYVNNNGWRH